MLRATGETLRHSYACLLENRLRDVTKESLVERLQRLVHIGEHIPGGRLALENTQIVVGVDQAAGEAGEEYAYLERRHIRVAGDDAVFVAVAVEEKQTVPASQRNAGLVEQTVVQAYVLALRLRGDLSHFERLQLYAVGPGESHHIGDEHGCTAAQSAHRE